MKHEYTKREYLTIQKDELTRTLELLQREIERREKGDDPEYELWVCAAGCVKEKRRYVLRQLAEYPGRF